MKKLIQGKYTGERALYDSHDLEIINGTFEDGESPLKESSDLIIKESVFKWKYPLWYCDNVEVYDTSFIDTARSGIWYTNNIKITNCIIEAPKTFRRSSGITLDHCCLPNAEETLWTCKDIALDHVYAKGDYFGLNCENVEVTNFDLIGNYAFDGGKNIHIKNAKMTSKDSFWNCEDVVVENSTIVGEYLGWNSRNLTFINCTIDSMQGMCYIENLKLVNCKLLNTNLTFEFCTVDAVIDSQIESVKNPIAGHIKAKAIGEIILDEKYIDPKKVKIETDE